jgi:ankyrin repeat and BTB/POZ domain-containing protein 1
MPRTTDVTFKFAVEDGSVSLHKFILAARSADFAHNLHTLWRGKQTVTLSPLVQPRSFETVVRYLYSGEVVDPGKEYRDNLHLVMDTLHLPSEAMRLVDSAGLAPTIETRDLKRAEMGRVQGDFETFVQEEITPRRRTVESEELQRAREEMSLENPVWADCLVHVEELTGMSTLYYAHIAILTRAEYFLTMFTSPFSETKSLIESTDQLPMLQFTVEADIAPIVLAFLYTDRVEIPRDLALDVLYAADFLFLPRLKSLAAIALENDADVLSLEDFYEILRAAWTTNTARLEYFPGRLV